MSEYGNDWLVILGFISLYLKTHFPEFDPTEFEDRRKIARAVESNLGFKISDEDIRGFVLDELKDHLCTDLFGYFGENVTLPVTGSNEQERLKDAKNSLEEKGIFVPCTSVLEITIEDLVAAGEIVAEQSADGSPFFILADPPLDEIKIPLPRGGRRKIVTKESAHKGT